MVITMGGQGAVYARANGECGVVPAKKVETLVRPKKQNVWQMRSSRLKNDDSYMQEVGKYLSRPSVY